MEMILPSSPVGTAGAPLKSQSYRDKWKEVVVVFTKMLTVALCGVSFASAQPGTLSSVNAGWVNDKDSPLWIVGRTMNREDMYAKVSVINNSDRQILRAQLGWVISDKDHPDWSQLAYGLSTDLNLGPTEIREIGPLGVSFSVLQETYAKKGTIYGLVTLGVVFVKFSDGTEWTYPLAERRVFNANVSPADITQKYGEKLKQFYEHRSTTGKTTQGNKACLSPEKAESLVAEARMRPEFNCGPGGPDPWFFICNPGASYLCVPTQNDCSDYVCLGDGCPNMQCCILNVCTGQKICG